MIPTIFALFVLLNIVSSQIVSPLYGPVQRGSRPETIIFLRTIAKLPEFPSLLTQTKKQFGPAIIIDIYREALKRKARINRLEETLNKNPQAKEVLIELSALYKKDGDQQKSALYLKQAKELDPLIDGR